MKAESTHINKFYEIIIAILAASMLLVLIIFMFKVSDSNALSEHFHEDSYTLQALAWRDGRISLTQYDYNLELAIVNDDYMEAHGMYDPEIYVNEIENMILHDKNTQYYVSFPAVPTIPMLFLSFIYGENTPNNLATVLYSVIAFGFLILICRRLGYSYFLSICGASFVSITSSAFYLAANAGAGGVWYQAQSLSLLLTASAFYFILGDKNKDYYIAFTLLALAVGCRPFQIIYFAYFYYILLKKYRFRISKTIKYLISPIVIGSLYMLYNYIRFGNIFEFGHNYLPEFMSSPDGQFSFNYILPNLKEIFCKLPVKVEDGFMFDFNGFACWISNVLLILTLIGFIYYNIRFIYRILKRKGINERKSPRTAAYKKQITVIWILFSLMILHLFLIVAHKTLGGWQFGSRYTVDLLPAALVMCAIALKPVFLQKKVSTNIKFSIIFIRTIAIVLLCIGTYINITGAYKVFVLEPIFDLITLYCCFIFTAAAIIFYIIYELSIRKNLKTGERHEISSTKS